MLVIRRKPGEEIYLIKTLEDGTEVIERVKVLGIVFGADSKPVVRLGIDAAKDTIILREELKRLNETNVQDGDSPQEQ